MSVLTTEELERRIANLEAENRELRRVNKPCGVNQQEPDYWLGYGLQAYTEKPFEGATPLFTTSPQAPNDLLEIKLPIAVRVGGAIFGPGVALRTLANHLARVQNYEQDLKDRMSKKSIHCGNNQSPDTPISLAQAHGVNL
jgi:hypothetical protein